MESGINKNLTHDYAELGKSPLYLSGYFFPHEYQTTHRTRNRHVYSAGRLLLLLYAAGHTIINFPSRPLPFPYDSLESYIRYFDFTIKISSL
jgi:hypothetical protein